MIASKPDPRDRLDILLIYPPWAVLKKRGILQNCLPPLGMLSIASYCLKEGFSVEVLDVHAGRLTDKDVIKCLTEKRPRYIGLSVLTNMAIPAHAIARLCKQMVPDCVVVAGGVHSEALPERMLRNSSFDVVVRGDGEEAMAEIARGKPFADILGLSYRSGNRVQHNPPRPVKMELDEYPMPAYHLVDFRNYFPAVGSYRRHPAINMLMTRGCPGKCNFCNSAFTTLRSRTPRHMVDTIKHLRSQYGIRQIQFYDDTFTVAKKSVLEFCRLLVEEKVDVTWTAYIRGDCFSEQMAEAMKKAGCHQVLMGIESGHPEILKTIGKPIEHDRYKKAVSIAHQFGIEVRGSFIIGNIGETVETMQASVDFAKELDLDLFQLNILSPYPGTRVYNYAMENGLLLHTNWNEYGQGTVLMKVPGLSDQEIYDFEKHAFRSFYLRPKQLARQFKRIVSLRQMRDLFMAFWFLILGEFMYSEPEWDCWSKWKEEDFFDVDVTEPRNLRLTFELRQSTVFQ